MKAILHRSYEEHQTNKENFMLPQAPSIDRRLGAKLHNTSKLSLAIPKPKWFANPTQRTKHCCLTISVVEWWYVEE
eukprot:6704961-Ditylum_brightwellii.AAC.1